MPEPPPVTIPTFPSTGAFLYFNTLASSVVDTISLCVFTKPLTYLPQQNPDYLQFDSFLISS